MLQDDTLLTTFQVKMAHLFSACLRATGFCSRVAGRYSLRG